MLETLVRSRWVRAAAVAVMLCAWPACVQQETDDDPVPSAGTPSLDFVLDDMNGTPVNLAEFRGRPILINFWATWCPPCKAEIPWFVEFAEKYRDQKLAVIGISVDDTAEDVRAFSEEYKINYPMLLGLGHDDVRQAYDASAIIPVSWLIKPDGTVFAKAAGIHSKEWFEDKIKALF
jgi:thiol-disulfide isomerase/thioredoxin